MKIEMPGHICDGIVRESIMAVLTQIYENWYDDIDQMARAEAYERVLDDYCSPAEIVNFWKKYGIEVEEN